MSNGNGRPPSFPRTRLFRKKSEKGNTYFTGRIGGARLVLLKSNDTADDGAEIWNLLISEAPKRDNEAGQRQEPPNSQPERQQAARTWQKPLDDDAIPFSPEFR
jgi:hypothetical protein